MKKPSPIQKLNSLDRCLLIVIKSLRRLQDVCGRRLNRWAATLSPRALKNWLYAFCLVYGGCSIVLMIQVWIRQIPSTVQWAPQPIAIPGHVTEDAQKLADTISPNFSELAERIKQYRHAMDSLGIVLPAGQEDSLLELEKQLQSSK